MDRQIVVAGEITARFIGRPPSGAGEETFVRRAGGALQLALALRGLGVPCALEGAICSDALGQTLFADAEKAGIGVSGLAVCGGNTGFSVQDGTGRELGRCEEKLEFAGEKERALQPLRPGAIAFFSAKALGKEIYRELYARLDKAGALLILGCMGSEECAEPLLAQADVICLDEASACMCGPADRLLQGRTQAVVMFSGAGVSVTTAQATISLPETAAAPKGELLFSVAVLLCQLYGAGAQRLNLKQIFADAPFTEVLLRCMAAACRLQAGQSEQLHSVMLHAARGEAQILAFAQRKMEENAAAAAQSEWRLQYHISAPSGWINDPNGLIQMDGVYHVFYQLHPFSPEWGPMYWGHATSCDLAHWKHEPIALAPDQPYEAGCFSGSAVNDNGVLTLLYTAHNDGSEIKECQCMARSTDGGRTFVKSPQNPVIARCPKDGSADFRDPKVWRQGGRWQMVVGSGKHKKGRALLYSSRDLEAWEYQGIMHESDGTQGVMWECPNFCTVDGCDLLIFSPMEMKGHKSVYCVGKLNRDTNKFVQQACRELDHGLNFYAAQVFDDEQGRTLMIAWMDTWGADFPTQKDGWAGALTLPRVLHMREGTLLQQPVPELALLREECLQQGGFTAQKNKNPLRELKGECVEILMRFKRSSAGKGFSLNLRANAASGQRAQLIYDGEKNAFSLPHGLFSAKERARKEFIPCEAPQDVVDIHIFVDKCSVEAFIDEGALCFTQRIYPAPGSIFYELAADGLEVITFEAWRLGSAF